MKVFKVVPHPELNADLEGPKPAKRLVPQWFRDAERWFTNSAGKQSPGLKACLPFLDSLTLGYSLVTPTDVFVTRGGDGSLKLEWDKSVYPQDLIAERKGATGLTIPRPIGHEENHLIWASQWGWKVPKGYSVLVTHPLNRHDLPFTTLSGVVDSDDFIAWGNIPFFLHKGFEGVIPAGTPTAQLIPFKRERWGFAESWLSTKKAVAQGHELRAGDAIYRKKWRKEKSFND
jgi:hypothetical protein